MIFKILRKHWKYITKQIRNKSDNIIKYNKYEINL